MLGEKLALPFIRSAFEKGASAVQKIKSVLQGGRGLSAARFGDRASGAINGKPYAKLPHPGLESPTPSSGRKLLQKNTRTVFENSNQIDFRQLPEEIRYSQFKEIVGERVYHPLYSRPAGRQVSDLTVSNGKTYTQVHQEYLDALPDKQFLASKGPWRVYGDGKGPIKQRVYINADPNHAPGLMEEILKDMDGINQAKIAKRDLGRIDNIVIYTDGDETTARVLKRLEDYQRKHPDAFRDGTPPTTHQPLRGVGVGDHPTKEMQEAARKLIAQRLGVDESTLVKIEKHGKRPDTFSYGKLRSMAHYFAEQDVQTLKATGKLSPQAEAFYREKRTKNWYEAIGIDANNPNKNLTKPNEDFQVQPRLPKGLK